VVIAAAIDKQVSIEHFSNDKRNILFSANDFKQSMCMMSVHNITYISVFIKLAHFKGN